MRRVHTVSRVSQRFRCFRCNHHLPAVTVRPACHPAGISNSILLGKGLKAGLRIWDWRDLNMSAQALEEVLFQCPSTVH
jgi:hypothetical protein